jgi:hypothetical protein
MVRKHLAHKTLRTFFPSSYTVTACKFGRNVRRVLLFDHGRLRPKLVVLPQLAHFAIFTSFPNASCSNSLACIPPQEIC